MINDNNNNIVVYDAYRLYEYFTSRHDCVADWYLHKFNESTSSCSSVQL